MAPWTRKAAPSVLDRGRCDGCGACSLACPAEALRLVGRRVTVDQVMEQLAKDEAFFRDSNGGITCSGGEPLLQPQFLHELLGSCRRQSLHVAVDTCGHAPYARYEKILPLTALFLYDLKLMDDSRHRLPDRRFQPPRCLSNLQKLSRAAANLAIRVPLVPGCNDSAADMAELADFCAALPNRHPVHLLPYHRGGSGKWQRLGRRDPLAATRPPDAGGRAQGQGNIPEKKTDRQASEADMTERIKRLRARSLRAVPALSSERGVLLTRYYQGGAADGLAVPRQRAGAFAYLLAHKKVAILPDELLVGERGPGAKATPSYPEITCHSLRDLDILDTRTENRFPRQCLDPPRFCREIIPYWTGKTMRERLFALMTPEWLAAYQAGVFTEFMEQRAPGHTVCGEKIYGKGMLDLKQEIRASLAGPGFFQ